MPAVAAICSRTVARSNKNRGKSIALPPWWLAEVNARFKYLKRDGKATKVSLAADLSLCIGREPAWDHKAVERFMKGSVTTIEMMWAFLRIWPSLIQPVFIARTRRDAEWIIDKLRAGESNPEWQNRYMELDEKLLEVAAPVLDQTGAVSSINEGQDTARKPHGRRTRSVD